jgi:serine/threonine protein kinase
MGSTDTISRSINQRETLHSRFDFIKVLGKGTYGKVKLANDKRTGKQVFKQNFYNIIVFFVLNLINIIYFFSNFSSLILFLLLL